MEICNICSRQTVSNCVPPRSPRHTCRRPSGFAGNAGRALPSLSPTTYTDESRQRPTAAAGHVFFPKRLTSQNESGEASPHSVPNTGNADSRRRSSEIQRDVGCSVRGRSEEARSGSLLTRVDSCDAVTKNSRQFSAQSRSAGRSCGRGLPPCPAPSSQQGLRLLTAPQWPSKDSIPPLGLRGMLSPSLTVMLNPGSKSRT